jgi:hypothetical protein
MEPVSLAGAARSYRSLARFVESGELARTLSTIGDVSTKAALTSLQSASFARRPELEVRGAITHLQTAHAAYESRWEGCGSYADFFDATTNDRKVLLMLALAYQYVGERELALRTIDELSELQARWRKHVAKNAIRHPIDATKRYASFYVAPLRSMKSVATWAIAGAKEPDLAELRRGLAAMEMPAAALAGRHEGPRGAS